MPTAPSHRVASCRSRTRAWLVIWCVCAWTASAGGSGEREGEKDADEPRAYKTGQPVPLKVEKLTSTNTQLGIRYYTLPFCQPKDIEQMPARNLGQKLAGIMVENSEFELGMREDVKCKLLCRKKYKKPDLLAFAKRIQEGYTAHWSVDKLPALSRPRSSSTNPSLRPQRDSVSLGFPIGYVDTAHQDVLIYNHFALLLYYNGDYIVGFEVEPSSKDYGTGCAVNTEAQHIDVQDMSDNDVRDVAWTYEVTWVASTVAYEERMNIYRDLLVSAVEHREGPRWFYFLTCFVVNFLMGTIIMGWLSRDLGYARTWTSCSNSPNVALTPASPAQLDGDHVPDDAGWKVLHGDVFRAPHQARAFAVIVGTGSQVLTMLGTTVFLCMVGMLKPSNRGSVLTAMLLFFSLTGFWAGHASARICKMLGVSDWRLTATLTATVFPSINLLLYLLINAVLWLCEPASALPWSSVLNLLVLWMGICAPLVFLGSMLGYWRARITAPRNIVTRKVARALPKRRWLLMYVPSLLAGMLTFLAVALEFSYVMTSIWKHLPYDSYTWLFVGLVMLCLTAAQLSIIVTYFHLCQEDYEWWWRAFAAPASSAVFLFCYAIYFHNTELQMLSWVSSLLYFVYIFMFAAAFALITGTVGYMSSLEFVRFIYGAIKLA